MSDKYDQEDLRRLWNLDYESLAMAPADPKHPNVGMSEARFILQARVALETGSLIKSTFWLAVATIAVALGTIALAVLELLK
jgi:hypothetical protein